MTDKPVPEIEQALNIANHWLEGRMCPLVEMVPGDPDCDACIVARQLIRSREALEKAVASGERAVKGLCISNQQLVEKSLQFDRIFATSMELLDSLDKIREYDEKSRLYAARITALTR